MRRIINLSKSTFLFKSCKPRLPPRCWNLFSAWKTVSFLSRKYFTTGEVTFFKALSVHGIKILSSYFVFPSIDNIQPRGYWSAQITPQVSQVHFSTECQSWMKYFKSFISKMLFHLAFIWLSVQICWKYWPHFRGPHFRRQNVPVFQYYGFDLIWQRRKIQVNTHEWVLFDLLVLTGCIRYPLALSKALL